MPTSVFMYSEKLAAFDYGEGHPFKPIRALTTLELCNRFGLLYDPGVAVVEPSPTTTEVLRTFHEDAYLGMLQRADRCEHDQAMLERGIGTEDCPLVPGLYSFALLATGATLDCASLVASGKADRAFNLVGGFHHAGRDHAEGFCYVNDVCVALHRLVAEGRRVAFVDLDAHHCNGVQDAFWEDDRVLVVSLHQSGDTIYPGTGFETEIGEGRGKGFTVNVPLAPMTDDEIYLSAFRQVVPPVLRAFGPDLVIAEIGADTMESDPITNLRLTTNGFEAVVRDLCAVSPRMVALGGGGYDVHRTARCWTRAWAAMTGQEPVDLYAGVVGGMMYGAQIDGLEDPPVSTTGEDGERARAQVEKVVDHARRNVFPILGAVPA